MKIESKQKHMKTIYASLITLTLLALSFSANTKGFTSNIFTENDKSLNKTTLLVNRFQFIKNDPTDYQVILKPLEYTEVSIQIANTIKQVIKELPQSTEKEESTNSYDASLDFGKLFFNFI